MKEIDTGRLRVVADLAVHKLESFRNVFQLPISEDRLFIAGGWIRDMATNVEPKDCDIIILADEFTTDESSFALAVSISEQASVYGIKSAVYQAYGQAADPNVSSHDTQGKVRDFDDNLHCAIQLCVGGEVVDVLLSRHKTIQDVINSFDCNMNQQYVGLNKQVELHKLMASLEWTGKPIREGRRTYMEEKWRQLYGD